MVRIKELKKPKPKPKKKNYFLTVEFRYILAVQNIKGEFLRWG